MFKQLKRSCQASDPYQLKNDTSLLKLDQLIEMEMEVVFSLGGSGRALLLTQPFARLAGLCMIEVFDRRFRERFAECCHAFLPFILTVHRETVYVAEVVHRKLCILPQCARRPAMETGHIE